MSRRPHKFAFGLKLFAEVMTAQKGHPLFEELGPSVVRFMKKLKSM